MENIGKNLKRIRLLNNLSLKEAGEKLNMSAPAIMKYENGDIIPNSEKLIEFANAYDVKVLDLLKTYNTPEMTFKSFRKKQKLQGKRLELLKEIIQNNVANYLEAIEMNQTDKALSLKKYSCNSLEDAEEIADKFREHYKLSTNQPISDLINILENIGIVIIQIKNQNKQFTDFDGLSEVVNNIPIIVILDDIEDGARQRFTIAHELGHLILDVKNKDLDEEKLCHRFASSLLMPRGAVIKEFGRSRNNISFFELIAFKKEYKVSISATIYRLKDLNIISEYLFKQLNIYLSANGYKKKEPINITPEESDQLRKIVRRLEIDGIISINKACDLLDISLNDYNKEDYCN